MTLSSLIKINTTTEIGGELRGCCGSGILAQVSAGAGGGVPVLVRQYAAIRTIQVNVSVLVVFFSAAKT